ncbi:MAG: creatininase family protein [Myxococcales bacterium]|nr:creatininase family protein [Myxococcales bacterium]
MSDATDRLLEWSRLTGRDFATMDKSNAVVMVSSSPMEVHGPHLPVVTDVAEADALAIETAKKLLVRHPEMTILRLPALFVAADVVPQTGSISFQPETVSLVLQDLGRSLVKQGFRHIWVSNFHGGPRHYLAIEQASHRTNKRYGGRMLSLFSMMIRRLTSGRTELDTVLGPIEGLSKDVLKGDSHAGVVETSLMLTLMGEDVDPSFSTLEQKVIPFDLSTGEGKPTTTLEKIKLVGGLGRRLVSALKYFESETYSGHPAAASEQIGHHIMDALSTEAAEALSELWRGELALSECHSPFWPLRSIFLSKRFKAALESAVDYQSQVW